MTFPDNTLIPLLSPSLGRGDPGYFPLDAHCRIWEIRGALFFAPSAWEAGGGCDDISPLAGPAGSP